MRPKKIRRVQCSSDERFFQPKLPAKITQEECVILTLDELEAMRLSDLDGLTQEETAKKMKVHRSTVSRILVSAHKKMAAAMVHIRPIKVEGGCCARS